MAVSSTSTENGDNDLHQKIDKSSSSHDHANSKNINAEELLPELRKELGSEVVEGVTDQNLLKFLRWKHCVKRASERFRAHITWRKKNQFAFDDANQPLLCSQNDELKRLLESEVIIVPEDLIAKDGSAVCLTRFRYNNLEDGRTSEGIVQMALYTIDRLLERDEAQIHGVTIIHDMKDATRNNVDIQAAKIMARALIGHFPIQIKAVYILEGPWFMKAIVKLLQTLGIMTKKVSKRIHFVDDIEEVYDVVDKDLLLEEHGGTLIYDQSEWVLKQMEREKDNTIESLYNCLAGTQSV